MANINSRRDKADRYTQRAHREGYPARSVYKLEELQEKFHLIHQGNHEIGRAHV